MLAPVADLQPYEALFGPLYLHTGYPAPGKDYAFRWLAAGSTIASPKPVDEVIESFVADASIVVTRSLGNRELALQVQVVAPNAVALALGEVDLQRECRRRRNTLTIAPPHVASVPAVFEVISAHLDDAWNDVDETRLVRAYTLRLTCAPYTRSANQVFIPALAQSAVVSTTTVSDGTSATNWTGTVGTGGAVTPVTSTGDRLTQTRFSYLEATGPKAEKTFRTNQNYKYSPAAPIDATDKPYLTADCHAPGGGWSLTVEAYADGVLLEEISRARIVGTTGSYRYRWANPDTSISVLELRYVSRRTVPGSSTAPGDVSTYLDDVLTTNQSSTGTGRQTLRSIEVGGSAPTQGSLRVTHWTDALGDALVYTFPETDTGYRPDLRRWRTDGAEPGSDTASISGYLDDITTPSTYAMPVETLPPGPLLETAAYVLVIRAKGGAPGQAIIEWTIDGVSGTTYPQVTTEAAFIPIAALVLPDTERGPLSEDTIDVTLHCATTGGAPGIYLDDAYLCYLDDGAALTIVNDVPRHLWVDAASIDHPLDAVFIGDEDSEVDKIGAGHRQVSRMQHRLSTGRTSIFTATSGAALPEVSASLYERWHTWPAR